MSASEDEALAADEYVEALIGSRSRPVAAAGGGSLDPRLRAAAAVLRLALPRHHPSFRFEESLAERLRMEAERMRRPAMAAAGVASGAGPAIASAQPISFPILRPTMVAPDRRGRGALLLGGAIASGVSIAGVSLGAALFAWRRSHGEHRWERLA